MSENWFYTQDGQQQGPVPYTDIHQMVAAGKLFAEDMIWGPTLPGWKEIGSVPGMSARSKSIPATPAARFAPAPVKPFGMPPLPPGFQSQSSSLAYATPSFAAPPSAFAPPPPDPSVMWLIPVGRSGWAIAAGYVGLISVIPIFAPVAIGLSLIAFNDLKKNPSKSGKGRAIFGMIMGVIFTILLLVLLLGPMSRRL